MKVRATAGSGDLILMGLIVLLLAGLPLVVWLDVRNLTEKALLRQANDLNAVVTGVRAYYASNVVGRVLASPGSTQVVHNYETIPGAIPIPATLSLELGRVISAQQQNISYRFVSDFPFKTRANARP
jgi:adenylate cyclase